MVGEGYEHVALQKLIGDLHATEWVRLAGRINDDDLVALYRRAWVVASASVSEGWGMTLTEAAACGTPAVATRIAGHADAVDNGRSGILVDTDAELAASILRLLTDAPLRSLLGEGARAHARSFTWAATAHGAMQALDDDANRRRRR